jgi:hypothetical protein
MGRKVVRGSRVKSGENGEKAVALRKKATPTPTPPHKGEGAKHSNPFMPGLRVRSDGWTAARTRVFLATLGRTGCVTDAARVAGVSTTSVNRSRALFPPFDTACGEAIARALRGLEAVAYERAVEGREMVILRNGKEVERRIVPSDSLLGLLLKRGDLKGGQNVHLTPEEAEAYVLPEAVRHRFLSVEEFFSGIIFDNVARGYSKVQGPTQEETDAALLKRIAMVGRRQGQPGRPRCAGCGQAMPLTEAEFAEAEAEEERLDAAATLALTSPASPA